MSVKQTSKSYGFEFFFFKYPWHKKFYIENAIGSYNKKMKKRKKKKEKKAKTEISDCVQS